MFCSYCSKPCKSHQGLTYHQRHSTRCRLRRLSSSSQNNEPRPATHEQDDLGGFDGSTGYDDSPEVSLESVERPEDAGTGYTLGEVLDELGHESLEELPPWISGRSEQLRKLSETPSSFPFSPFANRFSLQLATFAFSSAKLSRPQIQELLDLLTLIPNFTPPFSTPEELLSSIDGIPFQEMTLQEVTIRPHMEFDPFEVDSDDEDDGEPPPPAFLRPVSFRYYDVFETVQHLLARPDLQDSIDYTPVLIINRFGARVISNFMTANFAHQAQKLVPPHSTVIPLICASDETQLSTMCGQQTAYPGYLSIGNYNNDTRKDARYKTMVQLFQLPVLHLSEEDKKNKYWPSFLRQLLHKCLEIIFSVLNDQPQCGHPFLCPDGKYRLCKVFLASWIADYKEAVRIALIVSQRCPICICTRAELGLLRSYEARTKAASMQIREGGLTAQEQRQYGLKPERSFTDSIQHVDPHAFLAYDLLHAAIKPFGDHIVAWVRDLLSDAQERELTRRLKLMPQFTDLHHFVNGIDYHFQGDDNRNLMKIWIAVLVDLGVNRNVVIACRLYISYIYSLRRSKHTIPAHRSSPEDPFELTPQSQDVKLTTTIKLAEQQLDGFRSVRDAAFASVRNGTGFKLPRHHSLVHGPSSILNYGGADGTSSDIPEHLHIEEVKVPYRKSNKVEPEKQMMKYVGRIRKLQALHRYLSQEGYASLEDVAQERRGKRKRRSNQHRQMLSKWQNGEIEFPAHLIGSSATNGSLSSVAEKRNLPSLLSDLSAFLIQQEAIPRQPHSTPAEHKARITAILPSLRVSVRSLVNVYCELPDPTFDPTSSAKWLKSIVRSTHSWSYRDTSKRGGVSFDRSSAKRARYDHVFYQETNEDGFKGYGIGRVKLIFSVLLFGKEYRLAVIEEYKKESKDVDTGFWKLKAQTRKYRSLTIPRTLVIPVESITRSAHVVPLWKELDKRVSRWEVFDKPGHHAYLNHFIDRGTFDLMFCMIKPDRPPFCSWNVIGVFWKYALLGLGLFLFERVLREYRSRQRTWITAVVQHPSQVVELQFKKEHLEIAAGQFLLINCPEISLMQWHPFSITSAPEEDFVSIHIRVVGDFTRALAETLGCEIEKQKGTVADEEGARVIPLSLCRVLPRIMIDGPFGSASEDVLKYEVSILVAGGIGVTPFSSILKHIWYKLNSPPKSEPGSTKLKKVYFFWIFTSFKWFQSLLLAIEAQDTSQLIEIHTYLTAPLALDQVTNIITNSVSSPRDAITRLRAPTHYGRPNFSRLLSGIAASHKDVKEVGVFFCGPKPMGNELELLCRKASRSGASKTKFAWRKENF
ncbi:hypothetical protein JCM5350_001025 [Sporobolomyces pararoseus]